MTHNAHTGNGKAIVVTTELVETLAERTATDDRPRDFASLTAHFAHHGYPPPHPLSALLPLPTPAELAALTESIRINGGVRERITIFEAQILDGKARCLAAIALGVSWKRLPKEQFEGDSTAALRFVIDKNLTRRHLGEGPRALIAAKLATMRQGARTDRPQICGMSQEQAARLLNVSVRSLQHALVVLRHGVPDLIDAVRNEILPVSVASEVATKSPETQLLMLEGCLLRPDPGKAIRTAMRNAKTNTRHQQIIEGARRHDLGNRRYSIILADPALSVRVGRNGLPYPTLPVEQLCEFRLDDGRFVRDAVADSAILLLWILDVYLFDAPKILAAWGGFTFRRFMVWPKPTLGIGDYVRGQHELLLVCTRGNFPPPVTHLRPSSLIVDRRTKDGFHFAHARDNRHSSKPPRLQEVIEEAYPQYFRPETIETPLALELFARSYRPRWDGQGFEYPGRPQDQPIVLPKSETTRNANRAGHAGESDGGDESRRLILIGQTPTEQESERT